MGQKKCDVIVLNAEASYGNDPVPLYNAGEGSIGCVLELEALAQIQLSKAVFENRMPADSGQCSYFGLQLINCAYKYTMSAQSGDAYYVSTMIAIGQSTRG